MEFDRDPAEEDASPENPRRYKPVRHLYSSTTPCVNASGSSNVMSKKVKASKVGVGECREMEVEEGDRGRKLEKGRRFGVGLKDGGEMEEEEGERERKLEKSEIFGLRLEKLEEGRSFGLGLEEGGGVEGGGKLEKGGSFGLGMEEGGEKVEKGGSFGLGLEEGGEMVVEKKPLVVYSRRVKRARVLGPGMSYFDKLMRRVGAVEKEESFREEGVGKLREVKVEVVEEDSAGMEPGVYGKKRKNALKYELIGLGEGSGFAVGFGGPRLRKHIAPTIVKKDVSSGPGKAKKWVGLSFEDADPSAFVGLQCKVFWPMEYDWYLGSVSAYDPETQKHLVEYKDGDAERLILSNERIKFHVSTREVQILNLKYRSPDIDKNASSYDEMLALAVSYDDSQDLEAGDIVWAKLSGYSMWPALVMKETCVGALGVPKPHQKERMVPVQFFGTHDFARINLKQVKSFFRGLLSSFHLKSKQLRFQHSLEEAKMYLSQQQLPDRMIEMQKANEGVESRYDQDRMESRDDSSGDDEMQRRKACINVCPIEIGDLRITSLGKINDSEYFHGKQYIWPEGYTASRKFMSISNPTAKTIYNMEILRNPKSKARPLFRVTLDDGEQIEGSNPNACWKDIFARIKRNFNKSSCSAPEEKLVKSGSYMFGLSYPKIVQLIQDLPNSRLSSKHIEDCSILPSGYRAVRVEWKDIDRCNVCHMDEEYEDNLFLQCDKCRMMVHARCYGEIEPLDGVLWYCNLCRRGAPRSPPPCCLCPVVGGAMKPTTDGRWAHLTCAMWIPETCLLDIKRMEPIDGLNRISKDRWKLLCSICGVSYGACIQCCSNNCYAAYHPLCARAAGLCVELENEDQLHLLSFDEDDGQCVRLVSFCKKHRQPHNERSPSEEQVPEPVEQCATCNPPSNPSGCARTEPYNFFGRRGQKEPQILAAASTKRLYLENQPYLVRGCHQNAADNPASCSDMAKSLFFSSVPKMKHYHYDSTCSISSMLEKYQYMKATFKRRLAFGKSRIHGFGVFAKIKHKAGDMVIEYAGELVRPPIADIRERRIYNSLVGAGTYMFRIDNERVVDATRAGTIAHLINHSCEPNCYSRTITVNGNDHIIIFAKRDINQWEELSYDYRFFSKDEQLACFCGSSKCHGVVNDIETEEQITNLVVPRSELIPWHEE